MERVSTFLGRHVWLQLVLSLLVAVALVTLLFPGPSVLSVAVRTTITSLGAIGVFLARRRREKRAAGGSADDLVALELKLRHGDVPTAPRERAAMDALVTQRLRRTRHRVAASVCLAVLFTAVAVLMALTGTVRQAVGYAVLTVVFVGWSVHQGNVQHRHLET
ncbi:hypothetical protein GT039_24195, partial [Streptomyces sp. SID2955]|nr:hypothetical protein [Streptomyces sp. SID2955]